MILVNFGKRKDRESLKDEEQMDKHLRRSAGNESNLYRQQLVSYLVVGSEFDTDSLMEPVPPSRCLSTSRWAARARPDCLSKHKDIQQGATAAR